MRFTKMQGAGNDYVYVDCFTQPMPDRVESLAVAISDRRFGVGGDGLILITPHADADAEMRMYNRDGSYSEMCGNGLRCVARYLHDHRLQGATKFRIATGKAIVSAEVLGDRVRVNMGPPRFAPDAVPCTLPASTYRGAEAVVVDTDLAVDNRTFRVTALSMGNPHCVIVEPEVTDSLFEHYGPLVERHEAFPDGANVEFVEVLSPSRVKQRTWERGSGETLACGSGACAVGVAGVMTGLTERRLVVELLGGELEVDWDEASDHVYLTGPAVEVFSGHWPDDWHARSPG